MHYICQYYHFTKPLRVRLLQAPTTKPTTLTNSLHPLRHLQYGSHLFTGTEAKTSMVIFLVKIFTHSNTRTHSHVQTCAHIHTHPYARTHTHAYTHAQVHMRACWRTGAYTHKHTQAHTYTRAHIIMMSMEL